MLIELHVLLAFMIIGAIIAVETKNLLSAIISIGAVGFGLSIAFLLLKAPDIAMTQVVVEVLCLIILIRATISRNLTTINGDRELFGLVVTLTLLIGVFLFGVEVLKDLPEFGRPVFSTDPTAVANTYIKEGLSQTGAANLVTSVLLDYRAYDTLGEATVLFTAILGALAILRSQARKKEKELERKE